MNSIEKLRGRRVLVVGDAMIDRYLYGSVSRISPEAPVPVVNFLRQEDRLGGAGNVALNIAALGSEAILCSVVGSDLEGNWLELLQNSKLSTEGLIFSNGRRSTVKTRVVGNGQQVLRIDDEQVDDLSANDQIDLLFKIHDIFEKKRPDAVVLQDYNKGVLTERVIRNVIDLANRASVPTAVDPKRRNFFAYQGAALFKPNLKEIREATGLAVEPSVESLAAAAELLKEELGPVEIMVTLSEHGIYTEKSGVGTIHAARRRLVSDVSGAGDTVVAAAALGLAAGLPMEEIARICNIAGGQVCEVAGVAAVDAARLDAEFQARL